jgi:hypothetical protein
VVKCLPNGDLGLLGIATHKLSRIVARDRITGILRENVGVL